MKINKRICLLLLLFVLLGNISYSCTSYTHLWLPINEVVTSNLDPRDFVAFLENKISFVNKENYKWIIAINHNSYMPDVDKANIASSVVHLMDKNKYSWSNSISPFNNKTEKNIGYVWIDIVNASRMKFIWKDTNGHPLSMLRTGEFETASIRLLIQSDNSEVLLIDEFIYKTQLEIDFMFPTWMTVGGGWLRRVARKTGFSKNVEWTVAIPPDVDEVTPNINGDIRIYLEDK